MLFGGAYRWSFFIQSCACREGLQKVAFNPVSDRLPAALSGLEGFTAGQKMINLSPGDIGDILAVTPYPDRLFRPICHRDINPLPPPPYYTTILHLLHYSSLFHHYREKNVTVTFRPKKHGGIRLYPVVTGFVTGGNRDVNSLFFIQFCPCKGSF